MRQELARLVSLVLGLFTVGYVRQIKDDGEQQLGQFNTRKGGPRELESVIDDVPILGQYGFACRPVDGSEAILISLGGRQSQSIVIATGTRETRFKDLEPGEAAVYNGMTGAFVKFCADGKIRSRGDWEHEGSFKATGDILDHSATNTATMKVHRDAFNTHKHGGVTAGGAMTFVTDHTAP